jgi:hypothetical protein
MAATLVGQRELKGHLEITVTADGKLASYSQIPHRPGTAGHLLRVLESSLRKSMVLEDVTCPEDQMENIPHYDASTTEDTHRPEEDALLAHFAPPVTDVVMAYLDITPEEMFLLVRRAEALDWYRMHVPTCSAALQRSTNMIRQHVGNARRAGMPLARLFREHLARVSRTQHEK